MSVPADRPHSVMGRITDMQYILLKDKVEHQRHMSIQKLVIAAVNAYIRGDFEVHPDGSYTVGNPSAIYEGEDGEALDLDDAVSDPLASELVEKWGTAQLAGYAERVTGRRVSRKMLLELIREKYPQEGITRGKRYYWFTNDPELRVIIEDIANGALEEIRDRRMESFGGPKLSASSEG